MRVLVVGSSGYVGSRLIPALAAAGHDVVATARDPDRLATFQFPSHVNIVGLDVTDPVSCHTALAEAGRINVAFYLVHSIGGDDFADRDRASAANFGAAARRAAVDRIIYLGGFTPVGEELSEHLASRAEVGDTLADSTTTAVGDLVWLRAAVILGAGSTSFELIRYMVERLPVVPLPRWMRHHVAPIAVDDVVHYLIAAMDSRAVPAGSYDISNGQTLSYAALIRRYATLSGHRRWFLPVRGISPAMAAPIVAALTPIPKPLVADLVRSLKNTMDSQDHRIRGYVGDPPGGLTTIDDAIRRASVDARCPLSSTTNSTDDLRLATTDPDWAGGTRRPPPPPDEATRPGPGAVAPAPRLYTGDNG